MDSIIQGLQETLKTLNSARVYVNTKTDPLWISEIEKVYDDKWFLAKEVGSPQRLLINADHVSHVEF
jgi:hypothetical protein